tara:strand:- start:1072 stop:1518 length:447 start_codon:yes stop_codon:yes gene_type:complete
MTSTLLLVITASVMTAVADWAGWHYVWRHENVTAEQEPNKHSAVSIFFSYYLPFMPSLAVLLGPAKLGLYNQGFATVSTTILFAVLAVVTGGVAASAWSLGQKELTEKESRKLIDKENSLPSHALSHLKWTTGMLITCSMFWIFLLVR